MRVFVAAALAASAVAGSQTPAHAALSAETPRLQRVLLLPVQGRVSIVLEMSSPPASVTSRRISGDLVEVDAGPARVEHPQALTAPSTTPLVSTVLIDSTGASGDAPPTLRARITLRDAAQSAVRIQGARVYIDLLSADEPVLPQARMASPRAHAPAAGAPPTAAVASHAGDDEREQLQASMDRFGELLPFLTSAASAPTPQVLAALAAPTASLDRSVNGLAGTAGLRSAEGLLASATAAAAKAVDANYRGDRIEQVRQAAVFFEQARREIAPAEPRK